MLSPENICGIVLENEKACFGTVNKMSDKTEAAAQKGFFEKVFSEISQNSQEHASAEASFLIKLDAVDVRIQLKRDSSTDSFGKFGEICRNTFFAKYHRKTASDYSSINSSEGGIGNRNCQFEPEV